MILPRGLGVGGALVTLGLGFWVGGGAVEPPVAPPVFRGLSGFWPSGATPARQKSEKESQCHIYSGGGGMRLGGAAHTRFESAPLQTFAMVARSSELRFGGSAQSQYLGRRVAIREQDDLEMVFEF